MDVVVTLTEGCEVLGTVTTAYTPSEPVQGLTVVAQPIASQALSQRELTDAKGDFHFSALTAGVYRLSIEHDSLILMGSYVDVQVKEGIRPRADLRVAEGGVVSGNVIEASAGHGVAGYRVTASPRDRSMMPRISASD
jgi:hypothetical protein